MSQNQNRVERAAVALHHYFLWLLAGSYLAASVAPALGQWVRARSLGEVVAFGETSELTAPALLLGLLLFNAGLGVRGGELRRGLRRPAVLIAGIAANVAYPMVLLAVLAGALRLWHNDAEAQTLLVGLSIVAAMPIAGSSTGWAQNSGGNMATSLAMVLLSTLLSPLTTPALLNSVGALVTGEFADGIRRLAGHGTAGFLTVCVVVPSVLGVVAGTLLGERRSRSIRPAVRLFNSVVLLFLCYANASACLPEVFEKPDWDFLGMTMGVVVALSLLGFWVGHLVARGTGADRGDRASLIFGLGMNNNGTGLVMAGTAFAGMPMVALPILCYNLVQHAIAGFVSRFTSSKEAGPVAERE